MKANELRLNNYYELKQGVLGGGTCQLKNIRDFYNISLLMESESVKPIPLTEEWLLKFGFDKTLNQYKTVTSINKGNSENIPFIVLYLDNEFQYDDLRFRTNLKYVHQLQNLYFALTNEELKLTKK